MPAATKDDPPQSRFQTDEEIYAFLMKHMPPKQ